MNLFASLPVPVGNGLGAAVDVSAMGAPKTIVVVGSFAATLTVEVSEDGVVYGSLAAFSGPDVHPFVSVAARWLRVKISGYEGGSLPVAAVGAVGADTLFTALNVPAGNGVGTAADVSAYGAFKTVIVGSIPEGVTVTIEGAVNGTNFAAMASFITGSDLKSFTAVFRTMRVRIAGYVSGTLPTVAVAALADGGTVIPIVEVVTDSTCIAAGVDVVRFNTDDNEPQIYLPSVADGDDGRTIRLVHTSGTLDAIFLPNSLTEGIEGDPGQSYTFPALDAVATFEADIANNIWRKISGQAAPAAHSVGGH